MLIKTRAKIYKWLWDAAHIVYDEPDLNPRPVDKKYFTKKDQYHVNSSASLDTQGIHFKVIPGSGGIAIEVSHYDNKTERNTTTLYIIPENKDLSEELAQIITLESMKRH